MTAGGVTAVTSCAALCELRVSETALVNDFVFHLISKLASSSTLQVTMKIMEKTSKKNNNAELLQEMTISRNDNVILKHRNSILRALVTTALHNALNMSPYYLAGGGSSSSVGGSSRSASYSQLTYWMSFADSIRKTNNIDYDSLETHLLRNSFLLSTSGVVSLADLDVCMSILETSTTKGKNAEDDDGDVLHIMIMKYLMENEYHSIVRWIQQTCSVMVRYCNDVVATTTTTKTPPLSFVCPKIVTSIAASRASSSLLPVCMYDGTEDIDAVLQALQPKPKTKKKDKQQEQTTSAPTSSAEKAEADNKNPQGGGEDTAGGGGGGKKNKKKNKEAKGGGSASVSASSTAPAASPSSDEFDVTALEIRVGKIIKVWNHPDAEKLFCEDIDLGPDIGIRQIASGLRPFYNVSDLQDRHVLVLCNLKKRNLVGFPSHGMVLCASNNDHTNVEFVIPPSDTPIGERIKFIIEHGDDTHLISDVDKTFEPENKMSKKKIFEKLAPDLKTDNEGRFIYKKNTIVATTSCGIVKAMNHMKNAHVA